jgi:hypothetical protein
MPAIDWETYAADLSELEVEAFGREVFDAYREVVITGKLDEELTVLEAVALSAGEAIDGQDPNTSLRFLKPFDYSLFSLHFVRAFVRRFHEPLCAELQENRDLALLAPTIVTLLNLPVEYAALAVPISAIMARIGIGGLCKDYPEKSREEQSSFNDSLIRLHEANLRYLELERARLLPKKVPAQLDRAISNEEKRLKELRGGD